MANAKIDSAELEYLKSCRDKLRDIAVVLNIRERGEEERTKKETSPGVRPEDSASREEKLKEIEKIIKGKK